MGEQKDYTSEQVYNKAEKFYEHHKHDSEKSFNEAVYKELMGMKMLDDRQDFLIDLYKDAAHYTKFHKYDDPTAHLLLPVPEVLNNAWNERGRPHEFFKLGDRTKESTWAHPFAGEYTDKFEFKDPSTGSAKLYEATKKASDNDFDGLKIDKIPGYE